MVISRVDLFFTLSLLLTGMLPGAVLSAPIDRLPNNTLALPASPPARPYTATNAFGTLTFTNPTAIVSAPGDTNRLFIVEKRGRIVVVTNIAAPTRSIFLDLTDRVNSAATDIGSDMYDERGLLGLAFHPGYATNRLFYVFYTGLATTPGVANNQLHDILSSFHVSATNLNQGDSTTEVRLIRQYDQASNHNAGDLHFGPDGYLYVGLGDEGGAYGQYGNAQRIDKNFFSAIMRLDVDNLPGNLPPNPHPSLPALTNFSIPYDNPYVGVTSFNGLPVNPNSVRTEFWAVGMRNPWRFCIDADTGLSYLGHVGQDTLEWVNLVTKGSNLGWNYFEGGNQLTNSAQIPSGFLWTPPLIQYGHTNGRIAVIGGIVYRGSRLSQLSGAYLYGDLGSGEIWALRHSGTNVIQNTAVLTDPGAQLACFGADPANGDALYAALKSGTNSTINRIVYGSATNGPPLPPTLADTGAFADLSTLTVPPGVVPYDINVPFWSDNALKTRWFSIPDTNQTITFSPDSNWIIPTGAVWIKHFELQLTNGAPDSVRRLETRLLVKNAGGVYGVTYRWGNSLTNATLVPEEGMDENFVIDNGGGILRTQVWHYPGRAECLACHTSAGGFVLGFTTAQLNHDFDYGTGPTNELAALSGAGYFNTPVTGIQTLPALAAATNLAIGLEYRVRSYLAANCAQCHQPANPVRALWDARSTTPTTLAGIINGALFDNLGDTNNRVVTPLSPTNSVLLSRISTRGSLQMPPLASTVVDTQAVALVSQWISGMTNTFWMAATPASQSVRASSTSVSFSISNLVTSDFTSGVVMGLTGLPVGATAGFTPPVIAGSGSAVMNVTVLANTPAGIYLLTITGAGGGTTNFVAVTLVVTVTPPVATNDSYVFTVNSPLTVAAPGVLANDFDANGQLLSAVLVAGPAYGTLSLNTNGGFSYIPISNFVGADGFTYVANNGTTNSTVATVTLTSTVVMPNITVQPGSQSVVAGSNVSFGVTASGTAPLGYGWNFNGASLSDGSQVSGSATATLSLSNVQPGNAGNYWVVVTNVAGAVTSSVATLTVNVPGSCLSPASGLVGWWAGDGNATTLVGTNNGTLQGGATATATGLVAQAFGLNGSSAYVQIPDSVALRPTNLTVEAWVRFNSLTSSGSAGVGQQYIVFKQNTRNSSFEGYYLGKNRNGSGDLFEFLVTSAAGQTAKVTSGAVVQTGVWYHVAGVRGTNYLQLYVNGQSVGRTNVTFVQDYGNYPLYFGTSGESYWDGKLAGSLDEVSLYNRALSSNEVAAIYAAGAAGKCKVASGLSITTQPQSQSVAVSSNALFTVTATGVLPISYQWQVNGAAVGGATGPSLALSNVQSTNAGNYTVVVTNSTGSLTSAVAVLTVLVPPAITAQPQSVTNVTGSAATFIAVASGSAPLLYQWQLNGVNLTDGGRLSGAATSALTITNVQPADAGNYGLVVNNAAGSVTSLVATLTVTGPPVITVQPGSQSVVAGSNVSFSVTASGTAPLGYGWNFNGASLSDGSQVSGSATATLSLSNVQSGNAGNYWVVVTNVAGAVTSSVATLTVNVPGSCLSPPSGLVGWWTGDGNAVTLVGTNNGTLQGGATATATGLVAQAFGFNGSSAYVQIPDSVALRPTNLTVEAWVRFNSLTSSGSAGVGQQYIVFKQNTRNSSFEGYYLGKNRNGSGDLFEFLVTSAAGQTAKVTSGAVVQTGVWYHVAGVRGTNFLQLYVNGQLTGQTNVAFAQDYGNYPLYFGTSGESYWDGKLAGSLDEVSLYNRALSSNEVAAIYAAGSAGKCKVASGLSILAQPQNQSVVVGSNALFAVTATGVLPISYQWQFNGTAVGGATTSSLALNNVQSTYGGNYTVVVTNSTGSLTSAVAVLTVLAPPAITAQPQSTTNVAGSTATFSASASGSAPLTYQWLFNGLNLTNGGRLNGATTSALTISNVQPADAGNYRLTANNAAGSVTSLVATLTVTGPPVITVQPGSQSVVAGSNVSFSVTASGTAPLSYGWNFNGASLSDGSQVSGSATASLSLSNAQPGNAGNYWVVVTNVAGAVTSSVATLTVNVPGSCLSPPSGLVGWWSGDGNATTLVGTNNGTLQGGAAATATGLVAQAFGFNGSSAYVQIPDSVALRPTNLTVEAWVRFNSLTSSGSAGVGQQYIVFKQNTRNSSFEGYYLGKNRNGSGDLFEFLVTSAAGQTAKVTSGAVVQTGVWYHVAGVRGTNFLQLYVNGQLTGQTNVAFAQDYGNYPLYFGTSGESYWDGKLAGSLDEVSLYNRALSSNEVAAIYAAGAAGKCKGVGAFLSRPLQISLQILPPIEQDGQITFTVVGAPGSACVVEASADLKTWSAVETVVLVDGSASVSELITASRQFYRVKLLP